MSAGQRGLDPATPLAPTATGMILMQELRSGSIVAERFRIERILGIGGMGLVYLARDLELDVDVALKQLRPELAARADAFERFRKELLLARSVSSSHVVRIHDLVRHEQTWLISMDFVPGRSLERLLQDERRLDPERALSITQQLALGLAAAHASGVVHRDLKPANVLIDDTDHVRITDFGVARAAGDTGITGSGVVIGTPEYLSPEQARAEPLDGRSDLYALGLILYEMLTGTLPFRGGTPAEMMIQRVIQAPPKASTVVPDLPNFAVDLCAQLLSLEASDRPESASEVVAAIDNRQLSNKRSLPKTSNGFRSRIVLLALGLSVAALILQMTRWNEPVASDSFDSVASASLDVVPLPWSVSSGDSLDQLRADAAWYLLATRLGMDTSVNSAAPARVSRILQELGFDASAADRQHSRVLQVTNARSLIESDWTRDGDQISLSLRLISAGKAEPDWSWRGTTSDEVSLTDLLDQMSIELSHAIESKFSRSLSASTRSWQWETVSPRLALIGEILSDSRQSPNLVDIELGDLPAATYGLWLAWLEKRGMNARASVTARKLLDLPSLSADDPLVERAIAHALLLTGDSRALEALQALVSKRPQDAEGHRLLARAQAEAGLFEDAISTMQRLVSDDPGDGQAWFELARYTLQAGDTKRAVDEYLVRAQVIANRLEDTWLRADVANALGIGYYRLGQQDAALEELRRALSLAEINDDRRGQAASLSNLAIVLSVKGELASAKSALDQARTIIEPLGDAVALANLANDRGLLAEEEGDYSQALQSHRESLTLRQSQGEVRDVVESLLNVGHVYYQLGEFDNAQTYWEQALQRAADLNDDLRRVQALLGVGLASVASGNWTTARAQMQETLLVTESMQMLEEQSIALANLAELDRLEGRIMAALSGADTALSIFSRRDDQRGAAEMQLLKTQAYLDIGAYSEALNELSDLRDAPPGNAEQLGLLSLRLADFELSQGNSELAVTHATQAIEHASAAHALGLELQARLTLAVALHFSGHTEASANALSEVDRGLARFASVPLRLLLAETRMLLAADASPSLWSGTEALLARLPSYGNRWRLLLLASAQSGSEQVLRPQLQEEIRARSSELTGELRQSFKTEVERWSDLIATTGRKSQTP